MKEEEKRREEIAEFRYYEMPLGRYDLALLGDAWITTYRTGEQHFHNYYEIGYCHYGKGVVYMGKDKPEYSDGTISLIPPNFPHGTHSAEGGVCFWEWLYLDFGGFLDSCHQGDIQYKQQVLEVINRMPLLISAEEYPRLSNIIRAILDENREQKMLNKEAVWGYMYVLVQELLRLHEKILVKRKENILHMEKIRPALSYVEHHYDEEIRIEELAKACYISAVYFRKIFTGCMYISPLEYVNAVRIQKACELMEKEDIPMNVVAWRVGYTSVSTFERNFKKLVGMTPKQWKLKEDKEYVNYQVRVLKGWTE